MTVFPKFQMKWADEKGFLNTAQNIKNARRAFIKDQYSSTTTNYLGHITQAFKQGVITRQAPLLPSMLMQTKRTERTCGSCRGGRVLAKEHVTGDVNLEKCFECKGTGRVFV